MPSDFQMIRQNMPSAVNPNRNRENAAAQNNPPAPAVAVVDQRINNRNQILEEANRRLLEVKNRPVNRDNAGGPSQGNLIRNGVNVNGEDDAVSRLKRNLQLKSREEDHFLPKRFDEPVIQDRLGMAAFSVPESSASPPPRERRLEFLRRMEEKIEAMRRANRSGEQNADQAPSPKRLKRNCIGLFVCDISNLLTENPTLNWIEYKNYGIIEGAPERLIMSSIVAGNGELIMFGGLRKESASNSSSPMQVSNSLHFLTFPRGVI